MLSVQIERVDGLAIVACKGRIVRSEAAFTLRNAVASQRSARVILIDLSEVSAIEGGGLGMMAVLQRWACDRHIALKLFNPIESVSDRLEQANCISGFDIISTDEMLSLLADVHSPCPL